MTQIQIIKYWLSSSDNDYEVMKHLFNSKDYSWSLFLGHLLIEKLLKAHYVKNMDSNPPLIHNLSRLAKSAGLTMSEQHIDELHLLTSFNINSRYPDYKLEFYRVMYRKIYP